MTTITALGEAIRNTQAHLQAALPHRIVTDNWMHFSQRQSAELSKGVLTIIAQSEGDYSTWRGREAQLGMLTVLLMGQLQLDPIPSVEEQGALVAQAEFELSEEIKSWVMGRMNGWPAKVSELELLKLSWSGQLEAPRGWVAAELRVRLTA